MLKLMIVDDEPIILTGIRDMVERANTAFTKIATAGDSIEALEIIGYFQPDLVITDIQMPEMSGLEFIRRAKAENVRRFIILSGFDLFEYAQHAVRLQVSDYLLKPVDEAQLAELLKRMAIEVIDQQRRENEAGSVEDETCQSFSGHIKMLMDYIHNNYMKDISLSDAAAYLNLHPVYIGKLFKNETGDSFVHYLNQTRIGKAQELLTGGQNISLDRIAGCVGFENRRTFYKVFRKYAGLTPGQYRESRKETKR